MGINDDLPPGAKPLTDDDLPPGAKPIGETSAAPPAQPSVMQRAMTNFPQSIINAGINLLKGPQMGIQPPARDSNQPDLGAWGNFKRNTPLVFHPIDTIKEAFANDPVSTLQIPFTLAAHGVGSAVPEAAPYLKGAGKAAAAEVRPLLTGLNPLEHPFKVLPDLYDSLRNIRNGGIQAVRDWKYSQIPKTAMDVARPEAVPPPAFEPAKNVSLPSGRTPGPAPRREAPASAPRRPIWEGMPETGSPVAPIGDVSPIPAKVTPIGPSLAEREAARVARVGKMSDQVNWRPPESPVDTSAISHLASVEPPAKMSAEDFIRSQLRPVPKVYAGAAEHPPFAEDQPFSPSRAAREQTGAGTVEGIKPPKSGEPKGVAGNPKALRIALELKKEMGQ